MRRTDSQTDFRCWSALTLAVVKRAKPGSARNMSSGGFVEQCLRVTMPAAKAFVLSLAISAGAYAGGAGSDRTADTPAAAVKREPAANAASPIARAGDYIGRAVRNLRNEKLGEIIDLAIDGSRGRVVYAVMTSGGFLGLGQALHAVPLRELENPGEDKDLVLDLSLAALERHGGFDDDNWPQQAGPTAPVQTDKKTSNAPADAGRRGAGQDAAPDETPPE